MSERWWIPDPPKHRELESTRGAVPPPGFTAAQVINLGELMGDIWVCDICNREIPTVVTQEMIDAGYVWQEAGSPLPVPMLEGDALCRRCFKANGGMDMWFNGDASRVCACPACQKRLTVI